MKPLFYLSLWAMWFQHKAKVNMCHWDSRWDQWSQTYVQEFIHGVRSLAVILSVYTRDGQRGPDMAALKASLEPEVLILSYSHQLLHAIDLVCLTGCWSSEWMCREQFGLFVKPPPPPPTHTHTHTHTHSTSLHPPRLVTQASKSRALLIPP